MGFPISIKCSHLGSVQPHLFSTSSLMPSSGYCRKGQTMVIGRANSNLYPISAKVTYLESRSPFPNSGPLFTFQSGSFLTRGRFTSETRLLLSKGGLDSSEFAGHSFRIGAVTTAALANLPPWLIKVLGRWSSDCFERYIKTPPSVLAQVPQTLIDLL